MKTTCAFLMLAGTVAAQSSHADRVRSAMDDSLRRQRASVERQLQFHRKPNSAVRREVTLRSALIPYSPRPACEPLAADVLNPQIQQAAAEHGLVPELLSAVAHIESGYLPCAVSAKGAAGLMQIMPATGRDLGIENPWDSQQSLTAGAKYLRQLLDRYNGDVRRALGAYNAGPGRVDQYGDVPPIEETQNYVRKILTEIGTTSGFAEIPEAIAP